MEELRMAEKRVMGRFGRISEFVRESQDGQVGPHHAVVVAILVLAATVDEKCDEEFLVRRT